MYVPGANAVTDPLEIEAMLLAVRLGCLVTHDPNGLYASHLPFLYDPRSRVLAGHLALANDHWRRLADGDALIVFQGPEAYVSPNWYASKQAHGRVVPTWNYEAIHVYGRLNWRRDPAWLRPHLAALTDRFEADQERPWAIADAPGDYIDRLVEAVIGVEVTIERVEAKRKFSQNRNGADRRGVITALTASQSEGDRELAAAMARLQT
ncbi:MAG: transcriptional regulator [Caulobacteraceae bacterium]|nr:transcriptional regulator [Caulobacteraceae bacterium]